MEILIAVVLSGAVVAAGTTNFISHRKSLHVLQEAALRAAERARALEESVGRLKSTIDSAPGADKAQGVLEKLETPEGGFGTLLGKRRAYEAWAAVGPVGHVLAFTAHSTTFAYEEWAKESFVPMGSWDSAQAKRLLDEAEESGAITPSDAEYVQEIRGRSGRSVRFDSKRDRALTALA